MQRRKQDPICVIVAGCSLYRRVLAWEDRVQRVWAGGVEEEETALSASVISRCMGMQGAQHSRRNKSAGRDDMATTDRSSVSVEGKRSSWNVQQNCACRHQKTVPGTVGSCTVQGRAAG